jgi:NADPH-dependent 7-cyano-7-deazaguanine reductase QueF
MVELSQNDKWNMLSREDQQMAGSPRRAELSELRLQPNENRCAFTEHEHIFNLPECCPISRNPRPGSTISIIYKGRAGFLEVASLRAFIYSYVGGKGEVRSMEGMLQEIAQSCADILGVDVKVFSDLNIDPSQKMRVTCYAFPAK